MADSSTKAAASESFDIVSKYHSLLSSDPDLTPPIAAIESLIALLTASPATTISETLDLLAHSSATLRASIPNWIALSAGTDLFQRYLIQTLNRPGALGTGGDFGYLRQHLLSNGRLFVQRAKQARAKIAEEGRRFIREDSTVLTNGDSRVVRALLLRAAELQDSGPRFRVVYVSDSSASASSPSLSRSPKEELDHEPESQSQSQSPSSPHQTVSLLRSHSIPVSCIPYSALATALPLIDLVLVGAEGVVENGGIISRLGTHQIGLLARSAGKPVYVAAESYKFVRLYPLDMQDLPVRQRIIDFEPQDHHYDDDDDDDRATYHTTNANPPTPPSSRPTQKIPSGASDVTTRLQRRKPTNAPPSQEITQLDEMVDFTPPNLLSALITENGVLTPSAVSEELIKLWF